MVVTHVLSSASEPCTIMGGFGASDFFFFFFFFFILSLLGGKLDNIYGRRKTRQYIWKEGVWMGTKQNQLGIRIRIGKNSIRMHISGIGVLDLSLNF